MVQEADAGRNRRCPSPIEIDRDLDIRLGSLALDRCGAHGCLKSVSSEKWAARLSGWTSQSSNADRTRGLLSGRSGLRYRGNCIGPDALLNEALEVSRNATTKPRC